MPAIEDQPPAPVGQASPEARQAHPDLRPRPPAPGPRTHLAALAVFLLLTIGFYWRIALAGQVLVGYDLLTYFYPYRDFLNASLVAGRLPLWNPSLFLGVPFLANIQTAVFYPPNWLTVGLPAPAAVQISILLHVPLAGFFLYLLLRLAWRLPWAAALAGGVVFAFGGFLSQQVGHVNQLDTAAWLPLLALLLHAAIARRNPLWALGGAAVWAAMFFAGHTQEVYINSAGLAAYGAFVMLLEIARAPGRRARAATFGWALASLALLFGFGVAFSAVQALPTFELSGQSIRAGGLTLREARSFSLPPDDILRTLLPGFVDNPFSEFIGYVGFFGLALAFLAVVARPRHPLTVFALVLAAAALLLAIGGFNPLYERLYRRLPGLNLFRVPARWLLLYTFAMSLLAGLGLSALLPAAKRAPGAVRRSTRAAIALGLLTAIAVTLLLAGRHLRPVRPDVLTWWLPLGALALGLAGAGTALADAGCRTPGDTATRRHGDTARAVGAVPLSRWARVRAGALWASRPRFVNWRSSTGPASVALPAIAFVALLVELFLAARDLDYNHATIPGAYGAVRPAVATILADPGVFRVLSLAGSTYDPGDLGDLRAIYADTVEKARVTDFVVALKYAEVLAPNLPLRYGIATVDGYDGGVLPLRRYVAYKNLLLESGGERKGGERSEIVNQADGILREQLLGLPAFRYLAQWNVKYVIADRIGDAWLDSVYYDLFTSRALGPGETADWDGLPDFPATGLGLVGYLDGTGTPAGQPVATLEIEAADGSRTVRPLLAGVDLAEAHGTAPPGARLAGGGPAGRLYLAQIGWGDEQFVRRIRLRSELAAGRLVVQGLSEIDARTQGSRPLAVDPRLHLVHLGDVKVYENRATLPRAYVATALHFAADGPDTLRALRDLPIGGAVVSEPPRLPDGAPLTRAGAGKARITSYAPERVAIEVEMAEPGLLVLSDSDYPGWRARLDGEATASVRANYLFRAVAVPAGRHEVVFTYEPATLATGWKLSASAAVAAAALAGFLGRRAWRGRRRVRA